MKHLGIMSALPFMFLVSFVGTSFGASRVFDVDHQFYPYYPSLIKWNKSKAPFTPP